MQKIFLLFLSASLTLSAYVDYDMDGVEDLLDKCPNTLLTDLVDVNGCAKESLVSTEHFDIVFGLNYGLSESELNPETTNFSQALQVDYYNRNFSLQIATSYLKSSSVDYTNSGFGDTTISMSYKKYMSNFLSLKFSGGVILPTYNSDLNNNNSDYFGAINAAYMIGKASVFAGYSYTLINDDDVVDVISIQNTNSYVAGAGYNFTSKIYANLSYFIADSIDKDVEAIKSASIYMFYSIDKSWFTNLSYSTGLSDSASTYTASMKVGYYF